MTDSDPVEYEAKIMRAVRDGQAIAWGAASNAAVEECCDRGWVGRVRGELRLTATGIAALRRIEGAS